MSETVRVPAKINLHLGVGAPRPDGFHPLETVYQAISLYDDVTVTLGDTEDADGSLEVTGADYVDLTVVPTDLADNLAGRALALAASGAAGSISIHKSIPVAGGMAGGSADAAATLLAYTLAAGEALDDEVLLAHAAELGSDVPFALYGGNALGTGRGELVTSLPTEHAWWWVVVPSAEGLSTPAVYRRWDELFPEAASEPASASRVVDALASGDPVALAAALHNDLEAAALDLRPDLAALLEDGVAAGALRGIVSGSGPTCVFLCAGAEDAREVAGKLQASYDVVLTAHGPVAGAHKVDHL